MKRVAIVGAGPIGLMAALEAEARGLAATVLEQGAVGDALRRWGPTRLFSPLAMNVTARARALADAALDDGALLTGPEMAERVLVPVARALGAKVRTGCRVRAIGRARMTRGDFAGHALRDERPFRLLVETAAGEEVVEADAVLDASGVYGRPVAVGAGGLPAPGERALGERPIRDLGALDRRRGELAGRRVLLVGHGHSAANALAVLEGLGAAVTWATRSPNLRPCVEVACDPLPERARVAAHANALAAAPPPWLTVERRAQVESFADEDGQVRAALGGGRAALVDAVVALTGYRPDLSFLSELQLEISPVSEGAARLHRAVASITDCLSVPSVTPADLASGERGFHLIGAKSYGRSRSFLLQTGLAQLSTILDGI